MLQRELERWKRRRIEIQQRLDEIAKKEARLLAGDSQRGREMRSRRRVGSRTIAGAEGPHQEQGHLLLRHRNTRTIDPTSFEIPAMRRNSAMAEPGTDQRVDLEETGGRYVYAVIDDDTAIKDCSTSSAWTAGGFTRSATAGTRPSSAIFPTGGSVPSADEWRPTTGCSSGCMVTESVLPMAFGMIADSPDAVRRILELNRAAFAAQLRRVRGKVEMGTRVFWDKSNIYEYFVTKHAELKTYRDRLYRGGREPSREEKIALGRLFDSVLSATRAEATEKVTMQMQSRCVELALDEPRNEREAVNLACLVDRDRQKEFEQGVIETAALFDDDYRVRFQRAMAAVPFRRHPAHVLTEYRSCF